MNFKFFLVLIAALLLVFATSFLIIQNHEVLLGNFQVYGDLQVPIVVAIGLAFCAGLLISFIWISLAGASHAFKSWRISRRLRTDEAVEYTYGRGVEEIISGRYAAALKFFNKVLRHDPKHQRALLRAGEMQRKLGNLEEAMEYHQKAHLQAENDVVPLYAMVDDYEASGDWKRVESSLERIIALKPKASHTAYSRLRDHYIRQEKWQEAEAVQARIRPLHTHDRQKLEQDDNIALGIRYQMGLQKQKAGDLRGANVEFKKVLKKNPAFMPAYLAQGENHLQSDDRESALEVWEKGFNATNSPVFLIRITDFLLDAEEPERAIEIHRRVAARATNNIVARFMLGKLYYRLEMIDEALEVFQGLTDSLAHSPTLHYLLGRIQQRRGDLDSSLDSYRRVIRESHTVDLQYSCTRCRAEQDRWSDRCESCGAWSSIDVVMKENVTPEELGLSVRPVYLPDGESPRLLKGGTPD